MLVVVAWRIVAGSVWVRAVRVACAVACLVPSAPAAAQTPAAPPAVASTRSLTEVLTLEPGASCLERERLIAHVKMWLGGDRVDASVQIQVHGDPVDRQKLWFELARGGQSSRRSFEPAPDSCDDAHAVMGLSIALALDAERLRDTVAPQPAVPRLKLLSAQAAFAFDLLPDASLGGALGGELGLLPWLSARADVLVQYSWADTISGSSGHFDSLWAGGSLQVCAGGRADPRLRIALCVGLASGAVHAWGTDYAPSSSETGLWLGVRSGLRFDLELGIDWLLDVDVMSAIVAPAFTAQRGANELTRQSSSTAFMVSLGPALKF
jgi:hypothetical protein